MSVVVLCLGAIRLGAGVIFPSRLHGISEVACTTPAAAMTRLKEILSLEELGQPGLPIAHASEPTPRTAVRSSSEEGSPAILSTVRYTLARAGATKS